MNDEKLFIHTLNDLYKSINSNNEYEVLRVSGLIRQLFLDGGSSLFDRVNRNYRLKLNFEIAEYNSPKNFLPTPLISASFTELEPKEAPSHWVRKKLNRDKFFSYVIAEVEEHKYSIRELVKFAANIMGGIHSSDASEDKDKSLEKLRGIYIFSNINIALLFIKAVGKNILETLIPLRNKVLGIERFENAKGLSIFFGLVLLPLSNKENFIYDIGIEESRNRVSIFLNADGDLRLRYINNIGRQYLLNAGSFGYNYGQRTFLSFQLSFNESELFLCIEDNEWQHIQIRPITSSEFSKKSLDEFNWVIGSNVFGKAETHMELIQSLVYSRILSLDEQTEVKTEVKKDFYNNELTRLYCKGNQFYYNSTNPNFADNKTEK